MNTYILAFGQPHQAIYVAPTLEKMACIEHFYSCMSQVIFIESAVATKELAALLQSRLKFYLYILVPLTDRPEGYLPEEAWEHLKHPSSSSSLVKAFDELKESADGAFDHIEDVEKFVEDLRNND